MKTNLAVIGDPISHSLSPIIHTTVLEELGIDYSYEKIRIVKGELSPFLQSENCLSLKGFNLTMPHKQDVIPLLDYVDCEAQILNSVNTVKIDENHLSGYNTDGNGFLLAIKEKGYSIKGKNIVIFGAGGVVSTLALKLGLEEAGSIVILNRSQKAAEALAGNVLERTGKKVTTGLLTPSQMNLYCENCDILINGTPLGMEGTDCDFEDFSFLKALPSHALVHDLIYKPKMTNLLLHSSALGFDTLNGLGMLIYQGLLADEIFLDTTLDLSYFKDKIQERLKKL